MSWPPSLITDCAVDFGTAQVGVEGDCERPLTCSPPRKQRRLQCQEAPQCLAPSTRGRGRSSGTGGIPCRLLSAPLALFSPGPQGCPPQHRSRPFFFFFFPDPGPLWSRCVRAWVSGFGAICQPPLVFLSKALRATSLRSHLSSKVHMPKWLKTTQSVSSRVAVIQQSQSPRSRFRQGGGEASTLKAPCRGPQASPRSSGRAVLHPPYLGKPGSC